MNFIGAAAFRISFNQICTRDSHKRNWDGFNSNCKSLIYETGGKASEAVGSVLEAVGSQKQLVGLQRQLEVPQGQLEAPSKSPGSIEVSSGFTYSFSGPS